MAEARSRFWSGRHAGVLVPLFSIPSRRSWGIGEIPDLVPLARWLAAAGLDFVQFLPMNEMQAGQSSPYSALSAMAIDPIYISVESVEDWKEDAVLAGDDRALLDRVRRAERVDYASVRALKGRALRQAFAHFRQAVAGRGGDRDRRFRAFREREDWWLGDYALFRALLEAHGGRHWREWDAGVRNRVPAALNAARQRLGHEISYYAYLQWLADEQWQQARRDGRLGRHVRRLSVHGQQPQRRRLGAAARVRHRRLGRHAARRVLRDRPGLGTAGVSLGCRSRLQLQLAARSRPPFGGALRRVPHRSS